MGKGITTFAPHTANGSNTALHEPKARWSFHSLASWQEASSWGRQGSCWTKQWQVGWQIDEVNSEYQLRRSSRARDMLYCLGSIRIRAHNRDTQLCNGIIFAECLLRMFCVIAIENSIRAFIAVKPAISNPPIMRNSSAPKSGH